MNRQETKLGEYLHHLRQARGLSMFELAVKTGKAPSYFALVERGKRTAKLRDLWRIVQILQGDFPTALLLLCTDEGIPTEALSTIPTDADRESGETNPQDS